MTSSYRAEYPRTLGMVYLTTILLILSSIIPQSLGFQSAVDIPSGQRRCLGEQLGKHVLIVGEFRVVYPTHSHPSGSAGPLQITVVATDPVNPNPLFHQSAHDHVRTAFTTVRSGVHMFCVKNIYSQQITVDMQILWGPAARDYSQLAKAEHLDDIMIQLVQLQDKLKLYHNNVLLLREKEQTMRQETETTASRLIMFCGFNIFLLITSSVVSGYFFKRFFRSKKII